MEIVRRNINDLIPAPYNPRKDLQPQDEEYQQLKRSIENFGYVEPVIFNQRTGTVVGGHQRLKVLKDLGYEEIDCVVVDIDETQEKALNIALNKISGTWDEDKLKDLLNELNELEFDVDLTGFSVDDLEGLDLGKDDWFSKGDKGEAREGEEEYQEFLDKFEAKHTTDDCYTPTLVYDAVVEWVEKEYGVDRKHFVRPFYPGGDYQNEKYKEDDIVVDNPPFSILSEIVRFYMNKGIKFFLFCPNLTMFNSSSSSCTAIVVGVGIIYENKANVSTSFLTNLDDETIRVRTAPTLYKSLNNAVAEVRKELTKELPKYEYPDNVITSAKLSYFSKYGSDFKVSKQESVKIACLDAQKDRQKGLFGGGYLISEKAAAEKAAAIVWELSDREKEIIKGLSADR